MERYDSEMVEMKVMKKINVRRFIEKWER